MVQYLLPSADLKQRTVSPRLLREGDERVEADRKHYNPYNILEGLLLPALPQVARKFTAGQAFVDLARVGCALERYRIAQGQYPESLDLLTPQYISNLPHDVIGGQPLKYRRTSDGLFVLYSAGWNETDDGGKVVLTDSGQNVKIEEGDWVWQMPAR
jgi:hypothetical protein